MRKHFIICLLLIAFSASCAKKDPAPSPEAEYEIADLLPSPEASEAVHEIAAHKTPEASPPQKPDNVSTNNDAAPSYESLAAVDRSSFIPITWGFNPNAHRDSMSLSMNFSKKSGKGTVYDYIAAKFNIDLSGLYIGDPFEKNFFRKEYSDIFFADPHRADAEGLTRTIPREMIERYAPRYASLLSAENGWTLILNCIICIRDKTYALVISPSSFINGMNGLFFLVE